MSTEKKQEAPSTDLSKNQPSQSERFTNMVVKEFSTNAGGIKLTSLQRKLCQNYFIKLDQTLKDNEKKRLAKSKKYHNNLKFN